MRNRTQLICILLSIFFSYYSGGNPLVSLDIIINNLDSIAIR